MAVLQKYVDQGISVNTSYNPQFFKDEKIPMSVMLKHLIMCYKYGIKQLYYFNTYDGAGDDSEENQVIDLKVSDVELDESCDSCTI